MVTGAGPRCQQEKGVFSAPLPTEGTTATAGLGHAEPFIVINSQWLERVFSIRCEARPVMFPSPDNLKDTLCHVWLNRVSSALQPQAKGASKADSQRRNWTIFQVRSPAKGQSPLSHVWSRPVGSKSNSSQYSMRCFRFCLVGLSPRRSPLCLTPVLILNPKLPAVNTFHVS